MSIILYLLFINKNMFITIQFQKYFESLIEQVREPVLMPIDKLFSEV